LILIGILQLAPAQQPTSTSSVAGGLIIFIGPIPIFIGSGTPSSLVIIMAVIMAALTVIGVIIFRRRY
jgi:uncharacterized membrane protein